MACPHCRHLAEPAGPAQDSEDHQVTCNKGRPQQGEQKRGNQEEESLKAQIRELEQDLAQTKLKMVEARCKIQVSAQRGESEHLMGSLGSRV